MPVRNNPILGYTICSECEEPATVHQQSRGSGRFFYTRGCDKNDPLSLCASFILRIRGLKNSEGVNPCV